MVADEATSAVSVDVEGVLYEACKAWGASLVIISTRVGLKRYCKWSLTLCGGGGGDGGGVGVGGDDGDGEEEEEAEWSFERIGTEEERGGVERELEGLREVLGKVDGWRKRRAEIEDELGQVWVAGDEKESRLLEQPSYLSDAGDAFGKDHEDAVAV